MKCKNCGHTQFHQTVTVKVQIQAVVDGDGSFCDFVGDLNDVVKESDIIERDETLTCTECDMEYDPDEEGEEADYQYDSLEECVESGDHLTDVDDNGCCNLCGNQDQGVCSNCGTDLAKDEVEFCNKPACQQAAKQYDVL